jgi:hypothetical protein
MKPWLASANHSAVPHPVTDAEKLWLPKPKQAKLNIAITVVDNGGYSRGHAVLASQLRVVMTKLHAVASLRKPLIAQVVSTVWIPLTRSPA